MSDFSPILVLQIKICIKPDRHGKGSNKIWETLSFWRNFFNNGAIWLQSLICNRLNSRYEMQAVWLSIQRNHPFAYERLFLWRLMHRGCHHSSDVPPLASSDISHMQCRHDSQSHKGTDTGKHLLYFRPMVKTEDIHPPKTGISVHFCVLSLMAMQK